MILRRCLRPFWIACISIQVIGAPSYTLAQLRPDSPNPCDTNSTVDMQHQDNSSGQGASSGAPSAQGVSTSGLFPADHGLIVYDANQGVCWLADANLAGDPRMQAALGVSKINPNGTMDFPTAQQWVAALNAYNNGSGYLGHNNWQLPDAPLMDDSCADKGSGGGNFGPQCTGSAMGNLYQVGLGLSFPDSVAPHFGAEIPPLHRLKLSYYWALQNNGGTGNGSGGGGQEMYSFANAIQGGTTTKDSFYYVLPMVPGPIGPTPDCASTTKTVIPYTVQPAEDGAVYDCNTGYTWLADANLARRNSFGITGDSSIVYSTRTITVPLISGGAMLFSTANDWIQAMNASNYLASSSWQMPADTHVFEALFADLNATAGDSNMVWNGSIGPFRNLQPFFYWGCPRDQGGSSQSPCIPNGYAPPDGNKQLQWSFDFDYGLQATSGLVQRYFVMVYYPAPGVQPAASN